MTDDCEPIPDDMNSKELLDYALVATTEQYLQAKQMVIDWEQRVRQLEKLIEVLQLGLKECEA